MHLREEELVEIIAVGQSVEHPSHDGIVLVSSEVAVNFVESDQDLALVDDVFED